MLGLLASGALLEFFAWNSFFALNVVLAAVALIGTLLVIPTSRDADAPRLDPLGGLFSLLAAVGIVFGIVEGPDRGWGDALTVTGFAVGALALAAFVGWELRRAEPLLDVRLFRLKGFGAGSGVIMIQFFGSFGLFFIILQYLQYVADLSPFRAAIALLPLPVFLVPTARNAPKIAARFGADRVLPLGLVLSASGLAVMTSLGTHLVYWHLALGLALFGAGMGLAGTPATTAIVSSLPTAKQGVGSAMNDLSRELGSALGIAVLGSTLSADLPLARRRRDGRAAAAGRDRRAVVDRLREERIRQARAVRPEGPAPAELRAELLRGRGSRRLRHRDRRPARRCCLRRDSRSAQGRHRGRRVRRWRRHQHRHRHRDACRSRLTKAARPKQPDQSSRPKQQDHANAGQAVHR